MKTREPWRPGMKLRDRADRDALMRWACTTPVTDVTCGRCGGEMTIMPATKANKRGVAVCHSNCTAKAASR